MPTTPKRELTWLTAGLLAGVVVMPLLVYGTGKLTLGPYSRGGAGRFLADYLRSLAHLEWQALALALAPVGLVVLVRAIRLLRVTRQRADTGPAAAPVRREPTL